MTGAHASPGIFAVMAALGREETLARLDDVAFGIELEERAKVQTYVETEG